MRTGAVSRVVSRWAIGVSGAESPAGASPRERMGRKLRTKRGSGGLREAQSDRGTSVRTDPHSARQTRAPARAGTGPAGEESNRGLPQPTETPHYAGHSGARRPSRNLGQEPGRPSGAPRVSPSSHMNGRRTPAPFRIVPGHHSDSATPDGRRFATGPTKSLPTHALRRAAVTVVLRCQRTDMRAPL